MLERGEVLGRDVRERDEVLRRDVRERWGVRVR